MIHDREAAVKYFSWDNDQWISFDDRETFAQKVKWADSLELSGSLIWASDLGDYDNNAHKALTGNEKLGKRGSLEQVNDMEKVITDTSSFLGQGCEMLDKIEEDITAYKGAMELKTTKELVGYDAHGCKAKKVSLSSLSRKTKPTVLGVWFGMGTDYLTGLKHGMLVPFREISISL